MHLSACLDLDSVSAAPRYSVSNQMLRHRPGLVTFVLLGLGLVSGLEVFASMSVQTHELATFQGFAMRLVQFWQNEFHVLGVVSDKTLLLYDILVLRF